MSNQPEERYEDSQLYRIRHSAAHVMAQAVLEFYPDAKYTIGPPVENGFYYDFDLPQPIVLEDLEKIEKRMRQIIAGGPCLRQEGRLGRRSPPGFQGPALQAGTDRRAGKRRHGRVRQPAG